MISDVLYLIKIKEASGEKVLNYLQKKSPEISGD